jgi:hypothetical protein
MELKELVSGVVRMGQEKCGMKKLRDMSCRTGPLRVARSLRDMYTGRCLRSDVGLPSVGAICPFSK